MILNIITIINIVAQLLVLLVFVSVILSYFMDPYHPIRRGVDNIVEPMLCSHSPRGTAGRDAGFQPAGFDLIDSACQKSHCFSSIQLEVIHVRSAI